MSGTDQYHEEPGKMSEELKNFARLSASLVEEADAINWYEQRIESSQDQEVKEIMRHAQEEEFEHFAIDLEWLTRRKPAWREALKAILFKDGDILENAEEWEEGRE